MPILEVLHGAGLADVCCVVTRYFGGTKLGTGGLVSAYSSAVAGALEQVTAVTRRHRELATVSLPHADAGRIAADLRVAGVHIVDIEYGARALHTLAFDPGARTRVDAHLAASSHGTAALDPPADGGPRYTWVEEPTG